MVEVGRTYRSPDNAGTLLGTDQLGGLELLSIQAELSLDDHGRIAGVCGVTIGIAPDGQALWIGADVPEVLASELTGIVASASSLANPVEPPPALEHCERLLEAALGGHMARHAGPSYLFGSGERFSSGARIERSDACSGEGLRDANPGNWGSTEWDELLDGRLGPWSMATAGGQVLSICHTPRPLTDRAAECGVWTHPDARGRGHAAAVTAEWAAILRPTGRYLFYSTDANNRSSQLVAQRLNLRPLGWTWRIAREETDSRDRVHPLSNQSHRRGSRSL